MWTHASRQLLRALRGKSSQQSLSRYLGYKANPVREWEAGRRFPNATLVLRLARLRGVNVRGAFSNFQKSLSDYHSDLESDQGLSAWLDTLKGTVSFVEIAEKSEFSRHSVTRWLRGQARPRIHEFLALVDAMTGRACDLVAELVDIELVPVLQEQRQRLRLTRELAYEEPWSEAILRLLETEQYLDSNDPIDKWVSQRLGCSTELVAQCIDKLYRLGILQDREGRPYLANSLSVYTGSNPERVWELKEHWAQVATRRIASRNEQDYFAYNLMSLSLTDAERVRTILRNSYREIRAIAVSTDKEQVAGIVQLQFFEL